MPRDPFGPKLKRRVINTILLVALFRILALIPLIHADDEKTLNKILAENPLIGVVDLFAGGEVLSHFSIVAAGLFPYLTALVLVTFVAFVLPQLRHLNESEKGKRRIETYAKWATIPIAFAFAWGLSRLLSQEIGLFPANLHLFTPGSFLPSLITISLVTLGSWFSALITGWITKWGIYDGAAVLLLIGSFISLGNRLVGVSHGWPYPPETLLRLTVIGLGVVSAAALSIFLINAIQRVKLAAARPQGKAGRSSLELPLQFNCGGILPVSSALGLLFLVHVTQEFFSLHFKGPIGTVALFLGGWATPGNPWYWAVLALLVVAFTYFYNFSKLSQPFADQEISIAEQLKQNWIFVPGVRPGAQTEAYLSRIMSRITPVGALALVTLSVGIPFAILQVTQQDVSVLVLSVFVLVQTLDGLIHWLSARISLESYHGLLKRR
ncbi:MAG: hypothetical protein JO077_25945 [Verrucomicrobia bacterium]|nr:hypothetical protein [Verrucomicrobiota bacterium]